MRIFANFSRVSMQTDIPVLLGVVDDAPRHRLLVAEHAHVVVERCQVTVHHLGVVPHPNLQQSDLKLRFHKHQLADQVAII